MDTEGTLESDRTGFVHSPEIGNRDNDWTSRRKFAPALAWTSGYSDFSSVLLKQYDGTPLTLSEWRELRDLVSDCADELDMEIVTYVMSLIMDYGAL